MSETHGLVSGDDGFVGIAADEDDEADIRLCIQENEDKIKELAASGVRVRFNATGEGDPYCSIEEDEATGQIELIDHEGGRYLRTCPDCFDGYTADELVHLMN